LRGYRVKITFTIEDIKNSFDEESAFNEDLDPEDAPPPTESSTDHQAGSEENVEEDSAFNQPFAARLNINITKDNKPGALVVEALAQNNEIEVSDLFFFPDAKLVDPDNFDGQRRRERVYPGPTFQNLDEDLQRLVEDLIADRGVNEAMATFVADYIDWKEQNEYVKWLGSKFIPTLSWLERKVTDGDD
jgi:complement component 1 Q subcomponent-binding protein, mitochondrial